MDFRIGRNDLLRGLYLTHGIADRKNTIPILANVLIRASGKDKVLFAATDLKVAMMVGGSARVGEEGGITVGARQLYEIVKGLGGEEVRLQRTEQNWLYIESGKTEFKVVGMSDRDFPKLPAVDDVAGCKVEVALLREMIAKTMISISQDETRPHLASVLFESDGERATMVSTDGHRLSKVSCAMPEGPKLAGGGAAAEKRDCRDSTGSGGNGGASEIGVDQGFFVLKFADVVLTVKLGEGHVSPLRSSDSQGQRQEACGGARRVSRGAPPGVDHRVRQDLGHSSVA